MSRILVLTPGVFDKGGIARYGRYQIRALRETLGAPAVRVMSLMGPRVGDLESPFAVDWSGPTPVSRASRARFVLACARAALRVRPSVVLSAHVNLGPLARALARFTGARRVQNAYGHELWSGLTPRRLAALRRAEVVISDSGHAAGFLVEHGMVRQAPIVVRDCVDLDRFAPGESDATVLRRYGVERRGRFRILFLGRILSRTRYKGTERLLRVLAKLPPERFEAVLAGGGDDREHLLQLAETLGVVTRTRFTGPIHEDDLVDVYRSADAFYLASEVGTGMGEGLPLTPIEAMACGVPTVLGDRDGSREILEGGGGLCGDPEDLEGQAAYLGALAADPEFHARERQAALDRVSSAFGFDAFAAATTAAIVPGVVEEAAR